MHILDSNFEQLFFMCNENTDREQCLAFVMYTNIIGNKQEMRCYFHINAGLGALYFIDQLKFTHKIICPLCEELLLNKNDIEELLSLLYLGDEKNINDWFSFKFTK